MKMIISEAQFERFKKGINCPFMVSFEYVTKVTLNRGKRNVCVDEVFYKKLREEIANKQEDYSHKFSDDLIEEIKNYFYETYHMNPNRVELNFIRGGDTPTIGVKYNATESKQDVEERSRSFAFTRKKRLFSKSEMMANPNRYKKYDKEIKEIDVYGFSDSFLFKKPDQEKDRLEYKKIKNTQPVIKVMGDLIFYYDIFDDDGIQTILINVLDRDKKIKAAFAEFEMRTVDDIFVTLPYVRKEYREKGIATEIYKIILRFGNIVSGYAQSRQAVGLWKKMFNELPNKMVFIDKDKNEHEVKVKNGDIVISKSEQSVYEKNIGGQLKIYKT